MICVELIGLKFMLGAVYVHDEGSVDYDNCIFEDIIQEYVNIQAKLPICLIRYFNAKTGLIDDFF